MCTATYAPAPCAAATRPTPAARSFSKAWSTDSTEDSMTVQIEKLEARVHSITWRAEGIHEYELRPQPGHTFPVHTAGAHIDLYLANGLVRSYSLVTPQGETGRYAI